MSQQIIEVLSALLTPTVAVTTVLLTYRQYRIGRLMAKQALYSKRLECYSAAASFASELVLNGRASAETNRQFRAAALEAPFLLGNDVVELLQEILRRGTDMHVCESMISQYPDNATGYNHTIRDHQQWLTMAESRLLKAFQPYLSLIKD